MYREIKNTSKASKLEKTGVSDKAWIYWKGVAEWANWAAVDWMCPLQTHMVKPHPRCDGTRKSGLWEAIRPWGWSPINGIRAFTSRKASCFLPLPLSSTLSGYKERQLLANQEQSSHQTPHLPGPWSQNSQPLDCEQNVYIYICCVSLSGYGILL